MFKILLKKDLLSLINSRNRTKNKKYALLTVGIACLIIMACIGYSMSSIFSLGEELKVTGIIFGNLTGLVLILFSVIFETNDLMYKNKDLKLMLTLPVNEKTVILSKLTTILISCYAFNFAISIPTYIAYFINYGFDLMTLIYMLIGLLTLTLIPFGIGLILGMLFNLVIRKVKNKNLVSTISYVIFFIVFFILMSVSQNNLVINNDAFNYTFFPYYALGMAITGQGIFILYTVLISLGIFGLSLFVSSLIYPKIVRKIYDVGTTVKKKVHNSYKGELKTFLTKEAKKFFSSPMYILNVYTGAIISVFYSIIYVINDSLSTFGYDFIFGLGLGVVIFCGMISNSACVSLSMEGNNIKLIKSLPINYHKYLLSKILFNIIIIAPVLFIACLIFVIFTNLPIIYIIAALLAPIIAVSFNAFAGLLINVLVPRFDFKSDASVVKRSMSAFLGYFLPCLIALGIFMLLTLINGLNYAVVMLITEAILVVLSIVIYILTFKLFKKKIINYQ